MFFKNSHKDNLHIFRSLKRRLIFFGIIYTLCLPTYAAGPDPKTSPKYCTAYKQLHKGMKIGDVFLLMGPPRSFGQPPNINMNAIKNTSQPAVQPQNTVTVDNPNTRARILQSMTADPILGAFINAPDDTTNILIWTFENNTLSVSVKVKGPTVTDVKANFQCQ